MSSAVVPIGFSSRSVYLSLTNVGASIVKTLSAQVCSNFAISRTGVGVYALSWTPGTGPASAGFIGLLNGAITSTNYPLVLWHRSTATYYNLSVTSYNNVTGTATLNVRDMAFAPADPGSGMIVFLEFRSYPV